VREPLISTGRYCGIVHGLVLQGLSEVEPSLRIDRRFLLSFRPCRLRMRINAEPKSFIVSSSFCHSHAILSLTKTRECNSLSGNVLRPIPSLGHIAEIENRSSEIVFILI